MNLFSKLSISAKLKIIIIINHIICLSAFYFANPTRYHWVLALVSLLLLKVGAEAGFHRYFSHRSFKTAKWKERLLLILGSLNMAGSSLSWVAVHRIHHANADTANDPHSVHHENWFKVWTIQWKQFIVNPRYITDIARDPWHLNIHKWYFELCLLILLFVGVIDFTLLVFLISLPAIIQFHTGALLIDIVCHMWGYRNHETKDKSTNNFYVNLIALGSGLHNNHHARPNGWYFSEKPWEIDYPGFVIKHFLKTAD